MSGNIMEKDRAGLLRLAAHAQQYAPKDAVQLRMDRAGFLTAEVREDRCVECGLCREVCSRFLNRIQRRICIRQGCMRFRA